MKTTKRHRAATSRIVMAGLAVSSFFGIITTFGVQQQPSSPPVAIVPAVKMTTATIPVPQTATPQQSVVVHTTTRGS